MRKLVLTLLLLLCCCLPCAALAATEMSITPHEMGFDYDITSTEKWVLLLWDGQTEDGRKTLYSENGHFKGSIDLPYSAAGGSCIVTVQDLRQERLARKTVTLPQSPTYVKPSGITNGRVTDLVLTETATGFKYSFTAPDTDYMLLFFRTMRENATIPVYPKDASGHYEGEVFSPLTYARTLFMVEIRNASGNAKKEGTVRMGFEAPAAPEQKEGRLSGVVVCIDPGHQENGRVVTEPNGPGLSGSKKSTGGMAQGVVTLRRESTVALETSMILRDLLLQEGATVVLTREVENLYHTNIERCEIAEAAGAHIMLRIHCNHSSNPSKQGIGIYAPLSSDYAKAVADADTYRALGQAFLDEMKMAVGYEVSDRTGNVTLNNNYVGNNWAKMLCFLVEMGYMSNVTEDLKLATPEYQTMLSEGMVEGIYQVALMRGWIEE